MSRSSSASLDSYPPLFRRESLDLNTTAAVVDRDPELEEDPIPTIDLRGMDLEKLHEACREWGIFRLVNHGIPSSLLSGLRRVADEVFGLGFEVKQALFESIPGDRLSYFWGTPALTPTGAALQKAATEEAVAVNWVEGLNVPLSQPSKLHQLHQHPLLHSFGILLEEYGHHQARIVKLVFEAIAENLNLCSLKETESYISLSTGFLRVYRYPKCFNVDQPKVLGMEVHTDSSVLTILNQYEIGGLQILNEKRNVWIDVKPIPNTLVVHLGDMMQAMSDDKYKSVKHKVKAQREKERISMGYFVFPANDHVIRSSTYKPFTYPDFRAQVQHDIKTFGVKIGLSRFKVNDTS